MTNEKNVTPHVIAADAACNVVVPGVPSSYEEEEDERG